VDISGAAEGEGTLQSKRSVYEEELTQTIMAEFIAALTGVVSLVSDRPTTKAKKQKVESSTFIWSPQNIPDVTKEQETLTVPSRNVSVVILPSPNEYLQ
jgi:hypothetical protein